MFKFARMMLPLLFVAMGSHADEFKFPALSSPVMDDAGVIGSQQYQLLDRFIREANARHKVQLTVLTLQTLSDEPIEQASVKIVDKWKLGDKGKDNGVLFLIVPSEKKARIEVGAGLEGDLPDVYAKRILADVSRPYFRKGLYGDGILAGVVQILKIADPEFTPEGYAKHSQGDEQETPTWVNFIIFGIVIAIMILRVLGGGFFGGFGGGFGGGGFGGSSGGGGGGWSGGGGGFNGGGSSDSW